MNCHKYSEEIYNNIFAYLGNITSQLLQMLAAEKRLLSDIGQMWFLRKLLLYFSVSISPTEHAQRQREVILVIS